MDDLQIHLLNGSISVITGQRECDNEKLCAVEPSVHLKDFRLKRDSNPK